MTDTVEKRPSDLQAEALIAEIEALAAQERQAILEHAHIEARKLRALGGEKARRQMHRAVRDLRQREARELAHARAELETEARQREQAQATKMLAEAMPMLEQALAERWRDDKARASWIAGVFATATRRLSGGEAQQWLLRHPSDWSETDAAQARDAARLAGMRRFEQVEDAGLAAGVVLSRDGASLEATPEALLADRQSVAAALLAELARETGTADRREGSVADD